MTTEALIHVLKLANKIARGCSDSHFENIETVLACALADFVDRSGDGLDIGKRLCREVIKFGEDMYSEHGELYPKQELN